VSKPNVDANSLQQDETVVVEVNDGIEVPQAGHGLVQVGYRLKVDVFRGSNFKLTDVRLEPGDAIFARLQQVAGHTRVALNENTNARVRLETDFASITTLEPGTEFIVCHDPTALTCIVTVKGEIEVVGQDKVVVTRAGEGTFVLKDRPPFPAICARLDEVDVWLNEMLGSGEVKALGELVKSWPQESCAALAAASAVTPAIAESSSPEPQTLPSSEGMARIEAGTYTIGSNLTNDYHIPPMETELPAFWIDVYEVTNAQYSVFLEATGHAPPLYWPGEDAHPVSGVTWDDAVAYCTWANKRLPAEAEWEVAARGPGPNPPPYPWGEEQDGPNGAAYNLPRTTTYPVGSASFNLSKFGVYDMAGNVWEWVANPYYPTTEEGMKILRGGRYGLIRDMAYRQEAEPASERFVPYAGFRCATDRVQGE